MSKYETIINGRCTGKTFLAENFQSALDIFLNLIVSEGKDNVPKRISKRDIGFTGESGKYYSVIEAYSPPISAFLGAGSYWL